MKKIIRDIIKNFLKSMDFEMIYVGKNFGTKDYCANEYARQTHLQNLIHQLNINCILDIGANQGQYAEGLREIGYQGHIISFEPVSTTYALLAAAAKNDPKWTTYKLALGAENKTLEINLFDNSQLNSILAPVEQQDFFQGNLKSDQVEVVEVKTLDSIYSQLEQNIGMECRLLVKLDTQGFDLEVLEGGNLTLSKALCSQVEVSFVPIYQNVPSYNTVLQKFEALGFYVTNFFPNMGSDRGLVAIDFDCFMVSKNTVI